MNKKVQSMRPSPSSGHTPPVHTRFGQPGANPRGHGFWKIEDTLRYKLEQMMKLTEAEVVAIANDKDAPLMERRLARSLLKENDFKTTEAIANQVYGTPKQTVEQTTIELKPILAKPAKSASKKAQ